MDDNPLDAAIVHAPAPRPHETQSWRSVIDNRWFMLAMLFFVTAALGLPFLWISRGFSTFWKIVLTILVLAWTALILWVFWLIMVACFMRIADALR